jgi:hypothetical protein
MARETLRMAALTCLDTWDPSLTSFFFAGIHPQSHPRARLAVTHYTRWMQASSAGMSLLFRRPQAASVTKRTA